MNLHCINTHMYHMHVLFKANSSKGYKIYSDIHCHLSKNMLTKARTLKAPIIARDSDNYIFQIGHSSQSLSQSLGLL